MANEEHLSILKRGVMEWNTWRMAHGEICPDFSNAHLSNSDFSYADFSGANFNYADFYQANLRRVNFRGTTLQRANLTHANLSEANFHEADLSKAALSSSDLHLANFGGANLRDADLSKAALNGTDLGSADLSNADLRGACIHAANLRGADLYMVQLLGTIFVGIDLREVKGLENATHLGPSELGISVISLSAGDIPERFLRGCGLKDWQIEDTKLSRSGLSRDQIIDLTYKILSYVQTRSYSSIRASLVMPAKTKNSPDAFTPIYSTRVCAVGSLRNT